jgi:hypothetical protein
MQFLAPGKAVLQVLLHPAKNLLQPRLAGTFDLGRPTTGAIGKPAQRCRKRSQPGRGDEGYKRHRLLQNGTVATVVPGRVGHGGCLQQGASKTKERTMGIFESGAAIPLWILGAPLLLVIADAVMTPKVKPRDHYR